MASRRTSTARWAGPIGPADEPPSAVGVGGALAIGTLGAVLAWVGWVDLAPALGFPRISPPGMLNRTLGMASDGPLGWAVLLGSLAGLAAGYLLAAAKGLSRPGLLFGAIYGLVLWFVTGAILMPLMGLLSRDQSSANGAAMTAMRQDAAEPASALMRESFMMLHLGARAPIGALIAWVLFGGVLGAASSRLPNTRRLGGRGAPRG